MALSQYITNAPKNTMVSVHASKTTFKSLFLEKHWPFINDDRVAASKVNPKTFDDQQCVISTATAIGKAVLKSDSNNKSSLNTNISKMNVKNFIYISEYNVKELDELQNDKAAKKSIWWKLYKHLNGSTEYTVQFIKADVKVSNAEQQVNINTNYTKNTKKRSLPQTNSAPPPKRAKIMNNNIIKPISQPFNSININCNGIGDNNTNGIRHKIVSLIGINTSNLSQMVSLIGINTSDILQNQASSFMSNICNKNVNFNHIGCKFQTNG
eukprot:90505_1